MNETISYFRVDPHRVTLGDTLLVRRLKRFSIPDEPNSCRPYTTVRLVGDGCRGAAGGPGPSKFNHLDANGELNPSGGLASFWALQLTK